MADSPDLINVIFNLELNNPRSSVCHVTVESWQVRINRQRIGSGLTFETYDSLPLDGSAPGFKVNASSRATFPVVLKIDMPVLVEEGNAPADEYQVNLMTSLTYTWDDEATGPVPPFSHEISGLGIFPGVQAPKFTITAIAILKAELVNTRFRVGLRIDNPNPFPVDLSAFTYELYGNGRLWAEGTEKNIISVPAKSAMQGNLYLMMNFIDMRRDLLDQIIKLEDVNYRFAGEAQASTGVYYLPVFSTGYDLSGYSKVFDN